jgi:hypothetical protein
MEIYLALQTNKPEYYRLRSPSVDRKMPEVSSSSFPFHSLIRGKLYFLRQTEKKRLTGDTGIDQQQWILLGISITHSECVSV